MVHLSIFLSFLSLVGISNIFRQWIAKEFELTYYFACLFCIYLLYFAGLLNVLEPAVVGLRVIGLCGCLLFLNKNFRNKLSFSYGTIFIIGSILFLYWNINTINYAYYSGVDDYAHWGRMMMQITNKNSFIEANDNFATGNASNYPPAIALFQYMFSCFTGYQRQIGTFGQGVLTLSVFSVLFLSLKPKFERKNIFLFLALVLSSGALIWIFGSGLHSLQADLLLGSTMGVSLFIYHHYKNKSGTLKAILLAAPAILSLVLIKHIGILFAEFSLLIIAADVYSSDKKKFHNEYLYIIGLFIAILILRYTWTTHIFNMGLSISHSPRLTSIIDVLKVFIPAYTTEYQAVVIQNYIHYLFLSHHTSTYWVLATLILTLSIFKIARNNSLEIPVLAITSFYICFFAYLFILLLLYLFSFSESEGMGIASATRYIETMSLAMMIYFIGIFIPLLNKAKLNLTNKCIAIFTFLILIMPNIGRIIIDSYASAVNKPTQLEAYAIEKMAEDTVKKTPVNSKIYFIWVDLSSDNSVFYNYAVFPRTSNTNCTSIKPIGSQKSKDDPSPCYLLPDEFDAKISDYDFVYLAHSTEEFKQNFFNRLNTTDEPARLFEIHKNGSQLKLVKK